MTFLVWALPHRTDAAAYQSVINQLAEAQGVVPVEPHITLGAYTGDVPDLADVLAALKDHVLTPKDIGATDVFTRSLFVRFEPSSGLREARRLIEAKPGFRTGRAFDPHISLCYGPPPPGDGARQLAANLLGSPVRIDRLAVLKWALPLETHAQIAARRVLKLYP